MSVFVFVFVLPRRTSFRTYFGEFFWEWPISSLQSWLSLSQQCTTHTRGCFWALWLSVKPNQVSPVRLNGRSSSQRGPLLGRLSVEDDHHAHFHSAIISLVIGHSLDLFTRACSRVRASAKLTEGLWGWSTQKTAHATNFHETRWPVGTASHSAVFQVRHLKFWT